MDKKIIHTVFEYQTTQNPEKLAIVEEASNQIVNYGQLNTYANRIARHLILEGIEREDQVSVFLESGINLVASMLGTLKAGGVYHPVDPDFPEEKLKSWLSGYPGKYFITEGKHMLQLEALFLELEIFPIVFILLGKHHLCPTIWEDGKLKLRKSKTGINETNPDLEISPEQGSYVLSTSGTTGKGKAFMGTQKGLAHFLHWEASQFELTPHMRVAALSQITFDASLRDILLPLSIGGILYIPSKELKQNTTRLVTWLTKNKINLFHCVPSVFRLISGVVSSDLPGQYLHDLKYVLMAGEQLFGKDVLEWRAIMGTDTRLVNLYGTSETTMAKTFHVIEDIPGDDLAYRIPAGKAINNTIIAVIQKNRLCGKGEIGEIYIKTPFMTKGYLGDSELNARFFVQNPLNTERDIIYRTGDYGRWNQDGALEVLGRTDDQVKVNGIRVRLTEVEKGMLEHPELKEVVVISHQNPSNENFLICYYTANSVLNNTELSEFAYGSLSSGMAPAFYHQMDAFPLTINGKVDKRALPKPELILMKQGEVKVPNSEVQQLVHDIWSEVLNLPEISTEVSFFEIGGTSLQAIKVISGIYHRLKKELVLTDIFKNPTISKLADLLETIEEEVAIDIVPIRDEDTALAVSHAQKRLWITDQMHGANDFYSMPDLFVMEGEVDIDALKRTFFALVNRHESLRTRFSSENGRAVQQITPVNMHGLTVTVKDIGDVSEETLLQLASEEGSIPFDLQKDLLFRAKLFRMRPDKVACFINMHHIISDGWSVHLLVEETKQLYNAFSRGEVNPLPALKLQYKDFAAWQNQQLSSETIEPHRRFWLDQFHGVIPRVDLPGSKERFGVKSLNGSHTYFDLNKSITTGLERCIKGEGLTLLPVLMGVVKTLLYSLSGQKDLVVGIPVTARTHRSLQSIVGNFVNLLPIRSSIVRDQNFRAFILELGERVANAYTHQSYPFDLLVSELNANEDDTRSPIFDVLVQLQDERDTSPSNLEMNGLKIRSLHAEVNVSKFDLTFNFTVNKNGTITTALEYDTEIFDKALINDIQEQFLNLCELLVEQPETSMKEVKKLTLNSGEQALKASLDMKFSEVEVVDAF